MKSIIIAAGGTGGHLYPAIAVAEEIRRREPDTNILFIGTSHRIESREVPRAGFDFLSIDIAAPNVKNIFRFYLDYRKAKKKCLAVYRDRQPTAFLGAGAYVSIPAASAVFKTGAKVAILEINAAAGKANKLIARWAHKIFLAYDEARKDIPYPDKVEVIGTPVRQGIAMTMTPSEARRKFDLIPDDRTLLVFGGSLGARSINNTMRQIADSLLNAEMNIIWQTGSEEMTASLKQEFASRSGLHILTYINDMQSAYAASDLVVCRAGASTLAELQTLGKPAILIPYPFAAGDHQTHNAASFVARQAARMIKDNELHQLKDTIIMLMNDEAERRAMAKKMYSPMNKDASKVVAEWLLQHEASR
jgi:UDP-N-acetylglucosamine--N-acetylmuramyl-(pentapeptide) pyrophosphoryl-undecaprenol N-acetylglucosamine transferase